jgi:hypothetical protein
MNIFLQPNELWNLDVILAAATIAMTLVLTWPRKSKSCNRESVINYRNR